MDIISQFSTLLRIGMVLGGIGGFGIGLGLGIFYDMPLGAGLWRGAILCAAFAFVSRILLTGLFRAHVEHLKTEIEKKEAEKLKEKEKK